MCTNLKNSINCAWNNGGKRVRVVTQAYFKKESGFQAVASVVKQED